MTDSINIMAAGDHGNVATVMGGTTPQIAGYHGGSVPYEKQAKGNAVDVSEYAQLRLNLTIASMTGRGGDENGRPDAATLHVGVETSADGVSWALIMPLLPARTPVSQRVTISNFERYVRATWWYGRAGSEADGINDNVRFNWSLTADAVPAAA
jgi:hypothetical protein